jgi:RNA polymerase sigma-70 factor (ECF subfamily)
MFGRSAKELSDEMLVQKSAEGDRRSFEMLYDRYADKLYHYFLRMLWHDEVMAQDLTQEVFMKIVQKPEQFDTTRTFKTWVFSVAHNMCKNVYRHKEVRDRAGSELAYTAIRSVNGDPGQIDREGFDQSLKKALNEMDPEKRNTFILRFKHDLSIRDIAEITETSEGTVKSRIFYTLKALAVQLKAYNPNHSHER